MNKNAQKYYAIVSGEDRLPGKEKQSEWNKNKIADETFKCKDCGTVLPIKEKCSPDWEICNSCLNNYPNVTGFCSVDCRLTGRCDESC